MADATLGSRQKTEKETQQRCKKEVKKVLSRVPALRHRGLNCSLRCWHPTGALVQVLAVRFPIQLPANRQGARVFVVLPPIWDTRMEFWLLAWACPSPSHRSHVKNEPVDVISTYAPAPADSAFQTNTEI